MNNEPDDIDEDEIDPSDMPEDTPGGYDPDGDPDGGGDEDSGPDETIAEASRASLRALRADLKKAAAELKPEEARYLVDFYYIIQQYRLRADNQKRASDQGSDTGPNFLITWAFDEFRGIERLIKAAMDHWSDQSVVGRWAKEVCGVGPVMSAGLLAHIDITKADTAGSIFRFGGYDPTNKWIGKEGAKKLVTEVMGPSETKKPTDDHILTIETKLGRKVTHIARRIQDSKKKGKPAGKTGKPITRVNLVKAVSLKPWNADLKVLFWKVGQSFTKFSKRDDCFYGNRFYRPRKVLEVMRSERGDFRDQAEEALRTKKYKDSDTKKAYEAGKLPDGRLELRAQRVAVKLFLHHWHTVAFWERFNRLPPSPYAIAIIGHKDYVMPPHLEAIPELAEALASRHG